MANDVPVESKKKGSKALWWIGGCLVALLLVCVAGGVGGYFWWQNNLPEKNPDLEMKETEEYTFYYPNYYKETVDESYYQHYSSEELNSLDAHNMIQILSDYYENGYDSLVIDSLDKCNEAADIAFEEAKGVGLNFTLISSKYSGINNVSSCYFKSELQEEGKDAFIVETRIVNKNNTKPYSVMVAYTSSSDQSEIEDVHDALNAFKLK